METVSMKKILVTGGAGFIGSALARQHMAEAEALTEVDKFPCVGSPDSLPGLIGHHSCILEQVDIRDAREMAREGETLLSAKDACGAVLEDGEVFA